MDTKAAAEHDNGLGPAVMAGGGVIGLVGSFLTWASIHVNGVTRQSGALGPGAGSGGLRGSGGFATPGGGTAGGSPGAGGGAGGLPGRGFHPRPMMMARSFTLRGIDTTAGKLVLGMFVALIVVGVGAWIAGRLSFRIAAMTIGLVLAVIAGVLALTDLITPGSLFGLVGERVARAGIPVSVGPGLYLALGGAGVALIAGVAWMVASRRGWMGSEPARAVPVADGPPPPPSTEPPAPAEPPASPPPSAEPGLATS